MEGETIYRKTARGSEALATRHAALGPRERSALILVDGRRHAREIAAVGNAPELLAYLLAQGFIEPISEPATQPAALAPERPAAPALPLAKAQRLAVHRLVDLLGPGATDLCLRFEKTRNAQEFLSVVRHTEAALRQTVGAQAASRFAQELGNVQA